MSEFRAVDTELALRLVVPEGPALPVAATAHYAALDPWAVRVVFCTGGAGDAGVAWLLARQLLADGLIRPVGDGDVQVWPSTAGQERVVRIAMTSPSGSARFEIDRDELVAFLQQTYLVVPTGAESTFVDLDAELALLLTG